MSAITRLRQGLQALIARPETPSDADLAVHLTPPLISLFRALSPFDQAHLFRVYQRLLADGETDPDLLTAALLHDVGKVRGKHHVRLVDRVARVLLRRISKRWYRRLSHYPAPDWRMGLALAVHHPKLGATMAARAGCSERTRWLIALHEADPPPNDEELRKLMRADHAE